MDSEVHTQRFQRPSGARILTLLRTLSSTNGAQAEAARRMGLSRSALAYKLNKYGIRASAD
jgi:transcriptional regulator with GAF, ATPase, and Fis domain